MASAIDNKGVHLGSCPGSELPKILSKLSLKASTGELNIEDHKTLQKSKIVLKEGRIAQVGADFLSFRSGDLLVKRGIIGQKSLEEALNVQALRRDHPMLGSILIELKRATEQDINSCVFRQYEYVFFESLFFPKAEFHFRYVGIPDEGILMTQDQGKQLITKFTLNLSHDGEKYWPVIALIKPKMAPFDYIVKQEEHIPMEQLSELQKDFLKIINGEHSIKDIVLISKLDYFGIYAILLQLYTLKCISFVPPQGAKTPELKAPPRVEHVPVAESHHEAAPTITAHSPQKEEVKEEAPSDAVEENAAPSTVTEATVAPSTVIPSTVIPSTATDSNYKDIVEDLNKRISNLTQQVQKYEVLGQIFNNNTVDRICKLPFKKKQVLAKIVENVLDYE